MNARRAKRKARLARKRAREARRRLWAMHPELAITSMSHVLKSRYAQLTFYTLAYTGFRILGVKFKRRYNPANRARMYGPHPLLALLGEGP